MSFVITKAFNKAVHSYENVLVAQNNMCWLQNEYQNTVAYLENLKIQLSFAKADVMQQSKEYDELYNQYWDLVESNTCYSVDSSFSYEDLDYFTDVIESSDYSEEIESDSDDGDDYEDEDEDMYDIDVKVPVRKTRANVLSVQEASKCCKSSKNHKLKPRTPKRDKSKTKEAKQFTKSVRMSHSTQNV
jgi:hypothetical protein